MKNTILKYMDDTYCFASLSKIVEIGHDNKGLYLVFDETIAYPGGGGQPMDSITLNQHNKEFAIVQKCDFNGGRIKYYIDQLPSNIGEGDEIAMHIDRSARMKSAAYHTGGHWIASIITENLQLPLTPTKGFHFSTGAYVEFIGSISVLPEDILYQIEYAMRIDRQAQIKVNTNVISAEEFFVKKSEISVAENFQPMTDRPLRLVKFDTYKAVPCGGTHLTSIRELKSVIPTKVKVKNGKIRISYSAEMPILALPS